LIGRLIRRLILAEAPREGFDGRFVTFVLTLYLHYLIELRASSSFSIASRLEQHHVAEARRKV
jgi:hypothetical protein